MPAPSPVRAPARPAARAIALSLAAALLAAACAGAPLATGPVKPGTAAAPREVNVITRDYAYVPSVVDLVPGETVLLHVLNGGLETHEAVIGDIEAQAAWEAAEAAVAEHPPGPTPFVPPPAGFDGVRVVVGSGERIDVTWTVPADAAADRAWFVGCHIPGHLAKGMIVPVRLLGQDGVPLDSGPPPEPASS